MSLQLIAIDNYVFHMHYYTGICSNPDKPNCPITLLLSTLMMELYEGFYYSD